MLIQATLQKLLDKHNLTAAEMQAVMRTMMNGELSDAQIAGFLIALRCKGETIEEIAAAVAVLRELVRQVPVSGDHVIDTCGTGGDGANTFNISTTAAFVVAAAGGKVAKHGNRSVSSSCGSADVLEAAGINLDMPAEQVADCVNQLGVGFLFAAKHHSAVRHTVGPRKEMGVRTLFNLIGPMSNPANAPHQLIGVFDKHWLVPVAEVLKKLDSKHVLVVHAHDGLDEISIAAPTDIAELKNGQVCTYSVTPEQFGLQRAGLDSLAVGNARDSLAIIRQVLNNQPGPALDIVALNAGAAIYAADLVDTLADGIQRAQWALADGSALAKFEALIAYSKAT
ncbi:MAG: anthranilate phosphoribosyltransferase [Methylomonas sp.]|jgi:anthranilate phosphoribosyltransferase|uniref:anthranilate phosphoribosyltransferase n=1 Tax=Methylomonas sp. TaxID=418 RepID=UPI0025FEFC05|nr:anthranilate phosphoribosyltransferase [Methylomonas sp.]MCK9606913.1 anthranilate phosphoribosyltransferase [Methylomonas sp.]